MFTQTLNYEVKINRQKECKAREETLFSLHLVEIKGFFQFLLIASS